MDEKRILKLACAYIGADEKQVIKFRTEVEYAIEQVVLIVNPGKKYKIPLADLLEADIPAEAEEVQMPTEAEEAFVKSEPKPKKAKSKKVDATPGAKRLAREKKIDLGTVKGSGQEGRIIKADVEAVIKEG